MMRLPDETLAFLREQTLAMLCLDLDLGRGPEAVVVVKATGDVVEALRSKDAGITVGWTVHASEWGPAVCLTVRCVDDAVGEVAGEVYFDIVDEGDQTLLGRLGGQSALRFVFLSEELEPVWLAQMPWGEVRQLEVQQVADRAEELRERAPQYDFEKAKIALQEAVPLDGLLARLDKC